MSFPPPGQPPNQLPDQGQPGPPQPGPMQSGPMQSGPMQPGPGQPGPAAAPMMQSGQQQPPVYPPIPPRFGRGYAQRKKNPLVLPIIVIAIGAESAYSLMAMLALAPGFVAVAALLATVAVAALGFTFYLWLDRWEPEPPHLLVAAFVWGAGIATFFASIANGIVSGVFGDAAAVVLSAPFGEEALKCAFIGLVLLTTRRGRGELNSLTDLLIYAGIVGLGFTFIEDISYIVQAQDSADLVQLLIARIGLGAFGHSLYQSIFAVLLWVGLKRGGVGNILGFGFLGYLGAVLLHMMHNGSSLLGLGALVVVLLIELALFITIIVFAVRSSIGERKNLERQLPSMVHNGWLTPREGGWLLSTKARKDVIKSAGKQKEILRDFTQNATELAHLRTRLDQQTGQPPREWLDQHMYLAQLLQEQLPTVDEVLGRAEAQVPGGWPPVQGQPGQNWGTPQLH